MFYFKIELGNIYNISRYQDMRQYIVLDCGDCYVVVRHKCFLFLVKRLHYTKVM